MLKEITELREIIKGSDMERNDMRAEIGELKEKTSIDSQKICDLEFRMRWREEDEEESGEIDKELQEIKEGEWGEKDGNIRVQKRKM